MAAARTLRPPLRAATCETLIGLIAATGMRSGEAVRLDRDDIDWEEGGDHDLAIEIGQEPAALPVHPTTLAALARYAEVRDQLIPRPEALTFRLHRRHQAQQRRRQDLPPPGTPGRPHQPLRASPAAS